MLRYCQYAPVVNQSGRWSWNQYTFSSIHSLPRVIK